jgi:formylglycine-generating enzyme required for sulfatase activity
MMARLQHPSIVAIHDRGKLPDGRLWFAMQEVRGRTLDRIIEEVHDPDAEGAWTRYRLLESFHRVCQTVAYAHSMGVIHRDIKPLNLMIGEFGEVLVMDWGLARDMTAPELSGAALDVPEQPSLTQDGDVLGTPGYMAPEQLRGEPLDPSADVYALGVTLRYLLTGRHREVGPLPDRVSQTLRDLCARAMAPESAQRFAHAGELAEVLRKWLDFEERRRRASAALEESDALDAPIAALRQRGLALNRKANLLLQPCRPHDPVVRKEPGWDLQDEAIELERQVAVMETRQLQHVHAALNLDPEHIGAHERLADRYQAELLQAELRRDLPAVARFETLIAAHDRGRHTSFIQGIGALTLVTDPPAVRIELYRCVQKKRRLYDVFERELGPSPLHEVPLSRGSYVLVLHAPGCASTRYPVQVRRNEHWAGCPPGDSQPLPVLLPPTTALGADDVYVPSGWAQTGGDPEAIDGLPARQLWVDGFVMRRHPVTNAEYLDFLNDLVTRGRGDEALRFAPRERATAPGEPAPEQVYGRDIAGNFHLQADKYGVSWQEDWPVALVSWHAAQAYVRWLAEQTGQPWRLPHDIEWEKAARGVDGRRLPWGNFFDATWARTAQSTATPPGRTSVGQHPVDVSPYGVHDLTGNSRDWCGNCYQREGLPAGVQRVDAAEMGAGEYRLIRGGSWSSMPNVCYAAGRLANQPTRHMAAVGFRLVRSWPES